MKLASIVTMVVAAALVGCGSEPGFSTAPALTPTDPALAKAQLGLPPPPRVISRLVATFRIADAGPSIAQALTFVIPSTYNRDTLLTRHQLELTGQNGAIRANTNGVQLAYGIATAVSQDSSATLTLDLSQLSGFIGPLFVPCGTPVNCALLTATVSGSIFRNGQTVTATGDLKVRWETP